MTKRLMVLTIAAVLVLGVAATAMASGGEAPPLDASLAPTGKATITGTVVMDPHNDGATPTARYAVVTLHDKSKKIPPSAAVIKVEGVYFFGCDLSATEVRFVYSEANPKRMRSWIADSDLVTLFAGLGQTVSNTDPPGIHDPVITAVTSQACIDAPTSGLAAPGDGSLPGWFTMDFVVDFLTPGGR